MASSEADINIIITKSGLSKIVAATVDAPLVLKEYAVGDGGGSSITPSEDMSSLVNEKYRTFINDKYAENSSLVVECILAKDAPIDTGFVIRELGIFDDKGTMIAVAKIPDTYRPESGGEITTELMWNIVLGISNSNNITVSIPESVYASKDALERALALLNEYEASRIGNIFYHAGSTVPNHALECDGSLLNISDYPKLYQIIGMSFGGDADKKQFKLPDIRDRYVRGASDTRVVGGYEEDAIQNITGNFTGYDWIESKVKGLFKRESTSPQTYNFANDNASNGSLVKLGYFSFDASRVVRTADETRVKGIFLLPCIWYE